MDFNLELFERISKVPYLKLNQTSFYLVKTKIKENEVFTLAIYDGEPEQSIINSHSQIQSCSPGIIKIRGFKNMTSKDTHGFQIQRYSLLFEQISYTLYSLLPDSKEYVISLLQDLIEIVAQLQNEQLAIKYINPEDIVYTKNKKFKIINVREAFNYIGFNSTVTQPIQERNYHYMDQQMYEAVLSRNTTFMQNSYKSSIFSIALIVLEFYNQDFPKIRHDPKDLEKIICAFEQDFGPSYGALIRKMLEQDRKNGYNCIEAKENLPNNRPPVLRHESSSTGIHIVIPDVPNQFQASDNIKRSSLRISQEIRKSIKEWNGFQNLQIFQSEYAYYPQNIDEVEQSSIDSSTSYKVSQKALKGILNHLQYLPFIEFSELSYVQIINDSGSLLQCQIRGSNKTVVKFTNIPNIYILQILFNIQFIEQFKIQGICHFEYFTVRECLNFKNIDFCSDLYLIAKSFKGSLKNLKNTLNDRQTIDVIKQLISTVGELNKHIIHGVLTPQSIMLTEQNEISLIHYGLSDIMAEKDIIGEVAPYIPPEKLFENEYEQTSDIWNLGLIIYELLLKETITVEQIQTWGMADKDRQGSLCFQKNKVIQQCELLKQMTNFDHSKRITFNQLQKQFEFNFRIEQQLESSLKIGIRNTTLPKSYSQANDIPTERHKYKKITK